MISKVKIVDNCLKTQMDKPQNSFEMKGKVLWVQKNTTADLYEHAHEGHRVLGWLSLSEY